MVTVFVIVVYDVPAHRTERYKRMLRKRLEHVQDSVFCGDITEGLLVEICADIEGLLEPDDSVLVFQAERMGLLDITAYGAADEPGDRFT